MKSTLREELIQVAAVAIGIINDLDNGVDSVPLMPLDTWRDIREERYRQFMLWGPQHHEVAEWMAILGEEVGEAFKAALDQHIFPKPPQKPKGDPEEGARDGSNNYYGPEDFGYPSHDV